MALLRLAIGLVVWWYAFNAAVTYGSIWDSRAFPSPSVEVTLDTGAVETGDLMRRWDRSFELIRPDGSSVIFEDGAYLMMKFQRPGNARPFFDYWRSWGPAVLVTALGMSFLVLSTLRKPSKDTP